MKHLIRHFTTDRQTKVDIINAPGTSVVEIRFCFAAGFLYFDSKNYHVPHMLEHLLLGHSTLFADDDVLMRALQKYGAVANASTDYEYIIVQLRTPKQHFSQTFNMILSNIYDALIKQKTLDIEREILLRETYEKFDGPGAFATAQIMSSILPEIEPAGPDEHIECIQNLSVERVKRAYKKFIRPENMRLVIAGDITESTEQKIKKDLRTIEKKFPAKLAKKPTPHTVTLPESKIINLPVEDEFGSSFAIANVSLKDASGDKKVLRSMADNLLFGMPAAIIPTRLRKLGLVYSVDYDVISLMDKEVSFLSIMANPNKIHEAIFEIESVLKNYTQKIPADDLAGIKGYASSIIPTLLDTSSDLMEWYLPGLLNRESFYHPPEKETTIISKATDKDIQHAIKRTCLSKNMIVGLVCHDADSWGDKAFESLKSLRSSNSVQAATQEVDQAKQDVEALRAEVASHPFLWGMYCFAMYFVLVSLWYSTSLPVQGEHHTTSFFDFVWNNNKWWLGLWVLVPLFIASMLANWQMRWYTRTRVIALAFISSLGYWFGVVKYFGDFGIEHQPWYEDIVSVAQPVFFLITAVLFTKIFAIASRSKR